MSNVRQGDTAVITDGPNRDRFVSVGAKCDPSPFLSGELAWFVTLLQSGVDSRLLTEMRPGEQGLCQDRVLRPIRDPGDDAVDEMVRIAGKPAKLVFDPSVPQRETETS